MNLLLSIYLAAALFSMFVGGIFVGVLYGEVIRYRFSRVLTPQQFQLLMRYLALHKAD